MGKGSKSADLVMSGKYGAIVCTGGPNFTRLPINAQKCPPLWRQQFFLEAESTAETMSIRSL